MYSLVSAPVLGFDLVRRDTGGRVAALLLAALEVREGDLAALAQAHDGREERAGEPEAGTAGMVAALRETTAMLAVDRSQDALRLLERTAVVGRAGLAHFVEHDVFDWTWDTTGARPSRSETSTRAVAAVCSAVGAAYDGEIADPVADRLLDVAAATAGSYDDRGHLGPCHEQVRVLLHRLRDLDPSDVELLHDATERARPRGWAEAVHSATWAIHLSERLREAARAQLHTVETLVAGPLTVTDLATGAWNLVSGATQALVVRDLLDDDTAQQLVLPLTGALGLILPGP